MYTNSSKVPKACYLSGNIRQNGLREVFARRFCKGMDKAKLLITGAQDNRQRTAAAKSHLATNRLSLYRRQRAFQMSWS